jgi:fatty-acyl-CoA synthase
MPIRTLDDIEAIESIPLSERELPPNTYAALCASAARTPDARALTFFPDAEHYRQAHIWSYAELVADITRTSNAFHSLGVTSEHPVAFVLPNLPETHFTIWGGEVAGVAMAINPMLDADHIGQLLLSARARVLVTLAPGDGDLWNRLSAALDEVPDLKTVMWVSLARYREHARGALGSLAASSTGFDIVDFIETIRNQPADRLIWSRAFGPNDASSQFCTGGTTGLPKIALRTHGAEVFDAWAVGQVLGRSTSPRTFFCGLPLFHVNAQLVTGLLPWMQGDQVVIGTADGYRGKGVIARFWEIVAHYRISMFSGVPTIYATLLDQQIGDSDISSLEFAICGAAPMPATLIKAFEARTGVKILEGYGLTEGACVSSVNPPDGERIAGSIGFRLPYQRMRAVILDDAGRFLRPATVDEVGVIAINGPNVFAGYLDHAQNGDIWIELDGEKWLNTGDFGRQDARGYFWLAGRKKELIIRGGHNIDPKTIEDALCKHPSVALAAAIGRPDAYAGEIPVAYVQTKPGAAVTSEELLAFATKSISERAAVPKQVVVSDVLPMTAIGKISKPALQQLEIESVTRFEAGRLGVKIARLDVARDPKRGLVATVNVDGDGRELVRALERYTFASIVG